MITGKYQGRRRADVSHASSLSRQYYPNMDLMRYVLAVSVIIAHVEYLTGYSLPYPLSSYEAVGGFFAISGFLMYPNYIRHGNAWKYGRQRARRILPPYFFIVVACALGFCFISELGFSDYFHSKGLLAYLAANVSFLNWLHPDLPGVFQSGSFVIPAVNGSLWTMKVEWCLYFSVPCFVWLLVAMKRISAPWMALTVIGISIAYRLVFAYLFLSTGNEIYNILRRQVFGQLAFFYAGMLIFFMKDFFTRHLLSFLVAGVLLRIMMSFADDTVKIILEPFAISAMVMALSLWPKDISRLRHRNNISYEMYLFHFPLIQLGIWMGIKAAGPTAFWIYAFSATVILAYIVHICIQRYMAPARNK